MKKIKILVASVLCCAMGYTGYTAYEKMTMSEAEKFMIANVEALTSGETLPGLVCHYKGTTKLMDLIPCTATYPNIGKCGEKIRDWYSNDKAQCYK